MAMQVFRKPSRGRPQSLEGREPELVYRLYKEAELSREFLANIFGVGQSTIYAAIRRVERERTKAEEQGAA